MPGTIGSVRDALRGPAVLEPVPFDPDLEVDFEALATNTRFLLRRGMRRGRGFIVSPCGSGELVHLSSREHEDVVRATVEACEGELAVVAGVAANDIRVAIDDAAGAERAGADAVMLSPPFQYAIDEDSVVRWIEDVAHATDVAIMVYDQPWRVGLGTNITPAILERLAKIDKVVAVKYGGPSKIAETVSILPEFSERFTFVDNSLGFTSTISHIHGAQAFISGPAAWWPEFELQYWDLLEEGDYGAAERHHAKLVRYMHYFLQDEFPTEGISVPADIFVSAVIKASMDYVGLCGGPVRRPFRAMNESERTTLFAMLTDIGVPREQ